MRFLTPEEVGRLADSIHPRYRALVLVGGYGGLRLGELAGLRPHRVDLLRGRVEVAEIAVEVRGRLHYGPPKTKAGRRSVSLPRTVVRELESHLKAWAGKEFVFTAPEGGPMRTTAFRRRFWQPAVLGAALPHAFVQGGTDGICNCGLPRDALAHDRPLRPHDLRHTAVAIWIAAGANPKEIAVRAGHTSVSFTLDRYGHLFPDHDEGLRARLDEMILAAGPARIAEVVSLR
jgi:integrase